MNKLLTASLFLIAFGASAQENRTHAILQDQVKAFNNQNIEKLVANITDDFKWYYIGADTLLLEVSGKQQFQKSMRSYFESIAEVNSEITEYTVDKDRISFREVVQYVTASGETGKASAMGIYEIKDGLIYRAWYFL